VLDAAGEKQAWALRPPRAGNIAKVGLRIDAVTTAQDLDIRCETLDGSGNPTGTLWNLNGTGANPKATITPTAATWFWADLTDDAIVTLADIISFVVQWTGTVGNLTVNSTSALLGRLTGLPYSMAFVTGAWVKATSSPIVGLEYSDGQRYYVHTAPLTFLDDIQYVLGAEGVDNDEVGNRFVLPFRAECSGVMFRGGNPTQDWELAIYDSADNYLAYKLWNSDWQVNGGGFGTNPVTDQCIMWPASGGSTPPAGVVTLEPYTMYRIVAHLFTAGDTVRVMETGVDAAATMQAHLGGVEFYRTRRDKGTSDWANSVSNRIGIYPILSAIDTGFTMPIAPPVGAQ
jgi:hypothetical protein